MREAGSRAECSAQTDEAAPEAWFEELAVVRARIDERLETVSKVLAVMSGKGGVGKSAVAVHLAQALARRGRRVGLLDADLQSPSVAKMLGLRGQPLRMAGTDLLPIAGPSGVGVQSMDFFLQGTQPLEWDGPAGEATSARSLLEDAALGDLLAQTRWGSLDALVIDLAPGADRLPALARLTGRLHGAVAVTLPTEVALLGVERAVRRARDLGVALVGLVENMGSAVCGRCGEESALFREARVEDAARHLDLPLLARVPFDPALAEAGDAGRSFLEGAGGDSPAGQAFATLAGAVEAWEPPGPEGDSW